MVLILLDLEKSFLRTEGDWLPGLVPQIMGSALERPTGVQSQGPGSSLKYYSLNSPFSGPTWRLAPEHILDSGGRTAGG